MTTSAPHKIMVLYGSYRDTRAGIRLAHYVVDQLNARGAAAELIDAKEVDAPMLNKKHAEMAPATAPPALDRVAQQLKTADAFVFVTGEYNWGVQPGLKNLVDHFYAEWARRPAAIVSYSAGRFAGARAGLQWISILNELGMVVMPYVCTVGGINGALTGDNLASDDDNGKALARSFPRVLEELEWWTNAARAQRAATGTLNN